MNKIKTNKNRHIKKDYEIIILITFFILFIFYISWASRISNNTILIKSDSEAKLSLIVIGIMATAATIGAARLTSAPRTRNDCIFISSMFIAGGLVGLTLSLNAFDAYVYLFPDKTIYYISEYDVSIPGPYRGRYRCEAGLRLKDIHTSRWIELCTSKEELKIGNKRQQGMDAVWVTARVNHVGSYIVDYQFIFK
ncbi:hypothetical protein [Hafnia alvei]|uniref:Uncharacterized protein n=1 Tax=Hafnia alvei TaxID=569 RepID=A0A1C6YX70_HAFAL|nr:hypothetical protein [Hafnia alvei]SCM51478.1 hypothetical protein BN1044_00940 [Hafnia alvei]